MNVKTKQMVLGGSLLWLGLVAGIPQTGVLSSREKSKFVGFRRLDG